MKAPRSIPAFEAFMKSAMAVRPVHVVYTNASSWNMDSKFSHSQWSLRVSLDGGGGKPVTGPSFGEFANFVAL
jgi:hypothetical protein